MSKIHTVTIKFNIFDEYKKVTATTQIIPQSVVHETLEGHSICTN
jgi:hypothetical protein